VPVRVRAAAVRWIAVMALVLRAFGRPVGDKGRRVERPRRGGERMMCDVDGDGAVVLMLVGHDSCWV
jgi:hypothetical protein